MWQDERRKGRTGGLFRGCGFPASRLAGKITNHVSDRVFAALDRIGIHDPVCGLLMPSQISSQNPSSFASSARPCLVRPTPGLISHLFTPSCSPPLTRATPSPIQFPPSPSSSPFPSSRYAPCCYLGRQPSPQGQGAAQISRTA